MTEPQPGDAFGEALLAQLESGAGGHVNERDDGWVNPSDAALYFRPPAEWPAGEARTLDHVRGRVLDVGAGAGRYALELRRRGHDVLALDTSPGAVEVCRRRGVPNVFAGTIHELEDREGFDTLLLAGHNLGLLGSPAGAPSFLARLGELARPGARIVGTNRNPLVTEERAHLAYHQRNRASGRPPGQLRLRVRRHRLATPWFDYWNQGAGELARVVASHGWTLTLTADIGTEGSYLAVLER